MIVHVVFVVVTPCFCPHHQLVSIDFVWPMSKYCWRARNQAVGITKVVRAIFTKNRTESARKFLKISIFDKILVHKLANFRFSSSILAKIKSRTAHKLQPNGLLLWTESWEPLVTKSRRPSLRPILSVDTHADLFFFRVGYATDATRQTSLMVDVAHNLYFSLMSQPMIEYRLCNMMIACNGMLHGVDVNTENNNS